MCIESNLALMLQQCYSSAAVVPPFSRLYPLCHVSGMLCVLSNWCQYCWGAGPLSRPE